jgi:hypothetical protein
MSTVGSAAIEIHGKTQREITCTSVSSIQLFDKDIFDLSRQEVDSWQ